MRRVPQRHPYRFRQPEFRGVDKQLFRKSRALEIRECPCVNLPEAKSGRWAPASPLRR